jgi:hypothetical protein
MPATTAQRSESNTGSLTAPCGCDYASTRGKGPPRGGLLDVVLGVETTFSLAYAKPFPDFRFGLNEDAFGTPGAGGCFCFADPAGQIDFAYAMNKTGFYL